MDANRTAGAGRRERVVGVAGQVAQQFAWGSIQWLCDGRRFADAQQTVGYVRIEPGRKNPLHYHPNSDEVLFLLEGEIDHRLGDEVYHLTAGMAIHIPLGVEHDAVNRGERTALMLVSYPTPDRQVVMRERGEE